MTQAHTIIAQACLGVLLHIDENITKDDLQEFPLAEYAAEHLGGHARFEGVSPKIQDGLKRLFDPSNHHFSVWDWIYQPEQRGAIHDRFEGPSRTLATPLHIAAFYGLHDIVKFLIVERSQNVNVQGFNRSEAPLSVACRQGYPEVTRLLLEHGADTETRDEVGNSPLHWSSIGGHVAMARVLLENSADANAKKRDGRTPLHFADNEGVTRVLLEYGADPTARDSRNQTPLHCAPEENYAEVARVLLENGVDANARGYMG